MSVPPTVTAAGGGSGGSSLLVWIENWLLPTFIQENLQLVIFFGILTYMLLALNWIVTTDFESKFHYMSIIICTMGLLYLHYTNVVLLQQYENAFVTIWIVMLWYHWSTWHNNYTKIRDELSKTNNAARSVARYRGSVFRFFIVLPTTKNASNQWNPPPFKNAVHVLLIVGYSFLLGLHVAPFVTPLHCLTDPSPLCCRYNYAVQGYDYESHHAEVSQNYCSGRVRVAFAGSWSTGKTFLINALLGHR